MGFSIQLWHNNSALCMVSLSCLVAGIRYLDDEEYRHSPEQAEVRVFVDSL